VTDAQLYAVWGWSLVVAAVVVLLAAAEAIAEDTKIIWKLDDTNRLAEEVLEAATHIEERGGHIAGALQGDRAASGGGTV